MSEKIISHNLSAKVLMAGNYFENHHPGGISAVVQYWNEYIEGLQYYPTYKLSNIFIRALWFASSYIRLALRMMYDKNAKILHLHTAADGSFWRKSQLTKLGKFFGRKVVLHVHASRFKDFYNEASDSKKEWIRKTLVKVDVLVVLSNSWKEWFKEIGVAEERIVVLHNITPYPTNIPSAHIKDGKVHLLFMGEIGQRKGVFDILRGLAKHKDDIIGRIELRIGGNRNEEKLLTVIKNSGLEDVVKYEGWVGGDKKLQLLNWADVFVLPSFNEGLPISILEAMSYGHPIISTPVGGIPEVVEANVNGMIVTPGDEEQIYQAIKKYMEHPELIELEGKESYRRVETYLPDYVLHHLKCIYESLIY